jgi:hypothetical protein
MGEGKAMKGRVKTRIVKIGLGNIAALTVDEVTLVGETDFERALLKSIVSNVAPKLLEVPVLTEKRSKP